MSLKQNKIQIDLFYCNLISQFHAFLAEDPDGGDNSTIDDDLLDEDAVLNDESEEGILGEGGDSVVNDDDAALLTPTATTAP